MLNPTANVSLSEREVSELRLILERQTGVMLDAPTEKLTLAVSGALCSQRIPSTTILLERLGSSDAECEALAEYLLDGVTRFFRCPAAFESLGKVVLPGLEARNSADNPRSLRILSAGCSTGEEPYSIGMAVCEALNSSNASWNVHIVASDIRRQALESAERGLYPLAAFDQVPDHLVQAYFAKVGDHLLVKPRLRNLVRFSHMNLAKPAFLGQFDCIFCMDVLPHFSMAQRVALVQRLHLYLQPGGYLFLGQNEKLPASNVKFQSQTSNSFTLYRKEMALAARSGR
jgi:chemotaxis methyl-accepting protein methylase